MLLKCSRPYFFKFSSKHDVNTMKEAIPNLQY